MDRHFEGLLLVVPLDVNALHCQGHQVLTWPDHGAARPAHGVNVCEAQTGPRRVLRGTHCGLDSDSDSPPVHFAPVLSRDFDAHPIQLEVSRRAVGDLHAEPHGQLERAAATPQRPNGDGQAHDVAEEAD